MFFYVFPTHKIFSDTTTPTPVDPYQQAIETGNKYFQSKNYEEAIKQYQKAITIDSGRQEAFLGWAKCAIEQNDFDVAGTQIDKARSISDNFEAKNLLIEYFRRKKDFGNAENEGKGLIKDDPKSSKNYASLGKTYELEGKYDEALKYYNFAKNFSNPDPNLPNIISGLKKKIQKTPEPEKKVIPTPTNTEVIEQTDNTVQPIETPVISIITPTVVPFLGASAGKTPGSFTPTETPTIPPASVTPLEALRNKPLTVYFTLIVLVVFLLFNAWKLFLKKRKVIQKIGLEGTSDQPLGLDDPESQYLSTYSKNLAAFILNKDTKPPLTFSVTGKWGSGKSSFMNLVKKELDNKGFRTVWFNAWHHQKEEHILASLFEAIRAEALPSFFSLDGIIFRTKLFLNRTWRVIVGFFVTVIPFALSYFFLNGWPNWKQYELNSIFWYLFSFSFIIFSYCLHNSLVFGLFLSKLSSPFQKLVKLKSFEDQAGLRYRFQKAFKEITKALGNNRLAIFIDDLDRSDPERVVEVLGTINFLTHSGECYFVLGLEMDEVLKFIQNYHSKNNQIESNYSVRYLEKIINLEIRVPLFDPKQLDKDLERDTIKKFKLEKRKQFLLSFPKNIIQYSVFPLLIFSLSLLWNSYGPKAVDLITQTLHTPTAAVSSNANLKLKSGDSIPEPKKPQIKSSAQHEVPSHLPARSTPLPGINKIPVRQIDLTSTSDLISKPVEVLDVLKQKVPIGVLLIEGLLVFIILLMVSFRKKSEDYEEDSEAVEAAIKVWREVALLGKQTPRFLKRFKNKVRFLAICTRELNVNPVSLIILTAIEEFSSPLVKNQKFLSGIVRYAENCRRSKKAVFAFKGKLRRDEIVLLKKAIQEFTRLKPNMEFPALEKDILKIEKYLFQVGGGLIGKNDDE